MISVLNLNNIIFYNLNLKSNLILKKHTLKFEKETGKFINIQIYM